MKRILILSFFLFSAFCRAQIITTICGNGINGFSGDGGPAVAAEMTGGGGNVLSDNYGNIYFNDQSNSRIREINSGGIINTIAGTGVVGYGGDGGPATAALFNQNTVVGFDSSRNMYVVDYGNNRIRIINTSGIITTFAGNGSSGYSGNGGQATAAQLNWPCCVISDDLGNIYIADSWNSVIRKVSPAGIISLFAGTASAGYSGDGGPATSAQLNRPFRIIFDKQWNMYIADSFNSRIRKINTSGIITTFAGTGTASYGGDGGPATAAQVNEPYGVCVDTLGNVFIADTYNNRIREVNTSGTITTLAGTGAAGFGGDGGPAIAGIMNYPTGVSCRDCHIYVDDWNNNRLRMIYNDMQITATNDSVCAGDSTYLTATGATSYTWTPSTGLSCTGCANPAASPSVTTTYTVKSGCSSAQITITMHPQFAITLSGNDTVCAGNSTTITASGGISYLWNTGSTTDTISPAPTVNTTYSVKVGNGGCTKDTTVSIIVKPSPHLVVTPPSDTLCSGDSIALNATGAANYSWTPPAGLSCTTCANPEASPTITTTYTVSSGCASVKIPITVVSKLNVTLSGKDTVCLGNATTLTASGGTIYLWNTGATTDTISPDPSSSTTYSVHVSNGGCSRDTSIHIIVNPSPNLAVTPASAGICSGDSVAFTASGANAYSWTPAVGLSCTNCSNPVATPAISTTYIVTGSNADGCTVTKSIPVIVGDAPALDFIPDQTTCAGDAVTIAANVISGSGGTFSWQPGGSTNSSITVSPATATTYTVQYTNACGTTSTFVTINVNAVPSPTFSADITVGCAPLCVQFRDLTAISGSGNITMWNWSFGNGITVSENSPVYCYPDTGTFTPSLTVVSSNGCSATLQIDQMITVYSKPIANFIYSPNPVNILAPTVQFTDESTDAYGIAFRSWTFGDGSDSTSDKQNPSHTYQDTGAYCPKLVIQNNKGCIDTLTQCMEVDPIFALYIPDAFSPNRDGLNDIFKPKGAYVKNFEMYIFDRWGAEIFHSGDINQGWDGTVHGGSTISQEDIYVYKISATDWNNNQHNYVGYIDLIK